VTGINSGGGNGVFGQSDNKRCPPPQLKKPVSQSSSLRVLRRQSLPLA
jgi:hypothetical protein